MSGEVRLLKGVVKWYNKEKAYGFIKLPDGSPDVFVHANQLRKSGIENGLTEDEKVTFEVEKGHKGNYAINIKKV